MANSQPTPFYADESVTLLHGDCLDILRTLDDNSVDAVVTDPPYGLEFMGKGWDAPWTEKGINTDAAFTHVGMSDGVLRLPRPTFTSSTNASCENCGGKQRGRRDGTSLRPVCVCDFPKFPNVRATEMRAFQDWCAEWAVECLRVLRPGGHMLAFGGTRTYHRLACAVEEVGFEIRDSIAWLYGSGFPKSHNLVGDHEGWGTALKPAFEPIVVGRKPIVGTVALNVAAHGTGALHIDACRTGDEVRMNPAFGVAGWRAQEGRTDTHVTVAKTATGRWPTNVVLDGTQAAKLDAETGILTSGANPTKRGSDKIRTTYGDFKGQKECTPARGADSGGASRFFPTFRYEAKAPTDERPSVDGVAHPTVKPLDLMQWLIRLVTPPGGTVLEPFAGSGTTAEACVIEGFKCIAIEREATYLPLIVARLSKPIQVGLDFGGVA